MDILTLLKLLLNITDTLQDTILNFYIVKAQNAVKNYLNSSELTGLDNQITELAMYYYNNRDMLGKTQASQGSRSQSMETSIPQSIKDTLPMPFVRMVDEDVL